jgi:type IV secretory pathway component VirB8
MFTKGENETELPSAEAIESGAYYKDARQWYSDLVHRPIAERSYYVVVIILALVNFVFAMWSFIGIFPIHTRVPFVVYSKDIWADLPRIKPIVVAKVRDKNLTMMQFLLESYVASRESYDLPNYELRYRNVWSQSTTDVFRRYRELMDAQNIYGPYHLYTDRAKRVVHPVAVTYDHDAGIEHAHVVFTASVLTLAENREESRTKWQADISYHYTPFVVDQGIDARHWWLAHVFGLTGDAPKVSDESAKVMPMTFLVSDYQVKELLE